MSDVLQQVLLELSTLRARVAQLETIEKAPAWSEPLTTGQNGELVLASDDVIVCDVRSKRAVGQ